MHIRNTLVMAVVLVLMAGFVYFYEIRGREDREAAEETANRLVVFEPDQVDRIEIVRPDGQFVVEKSADGWAITAPVALDADGAAIDGLIDELHRAGKDRLISEAPEDPATYGLDVPDVTVRLGLNDGTERSVSVGKDTPIGANLYVGLESGEVYSATQGLRPTLALDLLDVRDRSILRFEESAVTRIELLTPELEAGLLRQQDDQTSWQLTFPMTGRADTDTVEGLLSGLHTSEVEAFVLDAGPDIDQMRQYGLDDPMSVVSLWTDGEEPLRLLVGSESQEPAGRYGMREGGNAVFVVPAALVEGLPAGAADLRNREVFALAREQVRSIELEHAGLSARVERDGVEWQLTRPRTLVADASTVSRLLSGVQDLRAADFASSGRGLDDPHVLLRLGFQAAEGESSEPVEIRIGATTDVPGEDGEPVPGRFVTASNDSTVYMVADEDIAPLRADLFELRDKTLVQYTETDLTRIEVLSAGATFGFDRADEDWTAADDTPEGFDAGVVTDLLWELNYLRMTAVASEWDGADPDLSAYGLASPRFTVRASTAAGVAADLEIGGDVSVNADGVGSVWIRPAGHTAVYEVSSSLADAVIALTDEMGAR
jgi:hypothetical protein